MPAVLIAIAIIVAENDDAADDDGDNDDNDDDAESLVPSIFESSVTCSARRRRRGIDTGGVAIKSSGCSSLACDVDDVDDADDDSNASSGMRPIVATPCVKHSASSKSASNSCSSCGGMRLACFFGLCGTSPVSTACCKSSQVVSAEG